jgi:ribosomal protein L37AE/L43A
MTHHEAFEHHEHKDPAIHQEPSGTCKVCSSPYTHEKTASRLGICEKCGYKILILVVIVMVAISYVAWFGVL